MTTKLDIAFWDYDRTKLLADGTVKIEGVDASFHGARIVPEIFEAMVRQRAYDVSELSRLPRSVLRMVASGYRWRLLGDGHGGSVFFGCDG